MILGARRTTCALLLATTAVAACGSPRQSDTPRKPRAAPPPASSPAAVAPTPSASASEAAVPEPPRSGSIVDKVAFPEPSITAGRIAIDAKGNRFVTGTFVGTATFGNLDPLVSRGQDVFLLKLDPSNKPLWAKRIGGDENDLALDVAVDDGGEVYLSVGFESPRIDLGTGPLKNAGMHDLLLAKFSTEGTTLWAKRYGDANDQLAMRLHPFPGGGVVATGWFNGAIDFGAGALSSPWLKAFYVTRIDAGGKGKWSKAFGHRIDFAETDSAVDDQGNVVVSGGSDGSPDFVRGGFPAADNDLGPVIVKLDGAGKTLSAHRFGNGADNLTTAIATDRTDGVRIACASHGVTSFDGDARKPQNGYASLVIASFDPSGAPMWKKEVFVSRVASVTAGAIDAEGNYYVSGMFDEDDPARGTRQDGYVVKMTKAGHVDWTLKIAEGTSAWLSGIALDPAGRPVAVGTVSGSPAGNGANTELWVAPIVP